MHLITKHNLFTIIKPHLPAAPTIIEAGAFDGRDTLKLHAAWPQATIHAFEPVPEIFSLLQKNTQHIPEIHCYPYALSDANGFATFHCAQSPKKPDAPCQAGSLLKPKERLKLSPIIYPHTIEVPTITLDDWAQKYQIPHVDFLWLDMQGYELNVMKAAPAIIKTVKVIYTEVELIEAYEGQYLYNDVKQWLESQGFTMVGRDFDEAHTWFYGNALFVR